MNLGASLQQWDTAIAAGLAVQGDATNAWNSAWGGLIESAHAANRIRNADWKRYAAQAWPGTFGLRLRPKVRLGDPLPYWVDDLNGRAAASSVLRCQLRLSRNAIQWGPPIPPDNNTGYGGSTSSFRSGSARGSNLRADAFPPNLRPGPQHVYLVSNVRIDTQDHIDDEKHEPLATGLLQLQGDFQLLPADQPSVKPINDPTLADAVRKSLGKFTVRQQAGSYAYVNVQVEVDNPPVALAFDVFAVVHGKETELSTMACPAHTTNHGYGLGTSARMAGKTIDLIFRSSAKAAWESINVFEYWNGELRFKDVRVTQD